MWPKWINRLITLTKANTLHTWSPNNKMSLKMWFRAALIDKLHANIFKTAVGKKHKLM